ncbi:MAG: hypothetical protein IPL46_32025 [Saprospiraceae bacterium]|nr:hypothetical protein [Saprospiraceae bacterium]
MNRILIGLIILLLACRDHPEANRQTNTWIGGEITNAQGSQIELLDAFGHQISLLDLEEGKGFSFDVILESGGYYRLKNGDAFIPIYLSPGYQLSIKFNPDKVEETLEFAGRGQESNKYIKAYESFEQVNKPTYELLLAKSEAEFLVEARRYRSKSEGFLSKYQTQNFNLDPNFIAKERARILYAWANRLIRYPEAHLYYTGEDDFAVSDTYHDYKKTVNLEAIDLITLPEYQVFITSYIDSEADLLIKKGDKRDHDLIRFDLANQLISEQEVKDYALYRIIQESLQHGMKDQNESLIRNFAKICQNGRMRAEIKSLTERWKNLSKGEEAPVVTGLDRMGNVFELGDHRGKFIYLNFLGI